MLLKQIPLSEKDLRERAEEYRCDVIRDEEKRVDLLIFSLGQQWYGSSVEELQQTLPTQPITALPDMHPAVLGLVNLRGTLLLTFDIRNLFNMSTKVTPQKIMVVKKEDTLTGILTETIKGVEGIPLADFHSKVDISAGIPPEFIRGITIYQDEPLLWLDMHKIVAQLESILR